MTPAAMSSHFFRTKAGPEEEEMESIFEHQQVGLKELPQSKVRQFCLYLFPAPSQTWCSWPASVL